MSETSDPRLYYPHVARNREPILDVLRRVLPPRGPGPRSSQRQRRACSLFRQDKCRSDLATDRSRSASDRQHCRPPSHSRLAESAAAAAARRDVAALAGGTRRCVMCNNMIHIAPWSASEGLVAGAARIWRPAAFSFSMVPTRSTAGTPRRAMQQFDARLRTPKRGDGAFGTSPRLRHWPNAMALGAADRGDAGQ